MNMQRSDRILVTHAGSLPRPDKLIEAYRLRPEEPDTAELLRHAVAEIVAEQVAIGIDVVNDGEFGKPMIDRIDYGAWATCVYGRVSGFEYRVVPSVNVVVDEIMGESRDRKEFAAFYADSGAGRGPSGDRRPYRCAVNVGPIKYTGHVLIQRDIANLKAALGKVQTSGAFLSTVFTGVQTLASEHYSSKDEQAAAIGEAMREEYVAITQAGLNVQIDDPILLNAYEFRYSANRDYAGFRRWAAEHVELLNYSLEGIPEDRIRYHLCWGSWVGPHSADVPLNEIIDLLLKVKAAQYSFEAANPQHEHEWKIWQDVSLPPGRAVIPGVVTHKTNVLEHPETVADRIVRYANAVGRDNVIAGTDCGLGGRIHPQLARAKLRALADGAALASEQLW
jgi:5-methyltetrahydropteroyltriglutamate--homocysteine methyltransferase